MALSETVEAEMHNIMHWLHKKKMRYLRERIPQLRIEYQNDPKALKTLDVYDPDSEYTKHFKKFRDAHFSGDNETEQKELKWFEKNYPEGSF